MFERYNESARRMLFFSRYECSQLGSMTIATEHLLLGLLREHKGVTARLLELADVAPERLRKEIESQLKSSEKVSTSVEIPFARDTKDVLQFGAEEADRLRHSYIGTEHLLLGMLREETSFAGRLLMRHGLTLADARKRVAELTGEGADEPVASCVSSATLIAEVAVLANQLAQAQPGSETTSALVNQIHVALGRLRGLLQR